MRVCHLLSLFFLILAADAARSRRPNSASTSSDCETKGCSHDCETVGELSLCVCPPDMALGDDGKTCKSSGRSFLLAMFRGIINYNEETEEEVKVAPVKVHSLDYHYDKQQLYVYTNYSIMRYPLSKGKKASLVSLVSHTDTSVTSLAVDWVHDVIFYICEQQSALSVMSLDGGDKRTLLTHNSTTPAEWRSLLVDPYAKKLFWIGSKGVHSASLEGEDLRTGLISWIQPDKIALDTSNQVIYAIGGHEGGVNKFIARASYNDTKAGEDIETTQPASGIIYGFGVLRNTAYWESNHDGENLYKCDLKETESDKARVTLVAELNQVVYDMKLYHRDVQKPQK